MQTPHLHTVNATPAHSVYSPNSQDLEQFLISYFSHPYWGLLPANNSKCYIRVAFTASKQLQTKYKDKFPDEFKGKHGEEDPARKLWMIENKVYAFSFRASDFSKEGLDPDVFNKAQIRAELEELLGDIYNYTKYGCDCYYYPNPSSPSLLKYPSNDTVIACLYWFLDWDYTFPATNNVEHLIRTFNISPAAVIQTSPGKYQALIGVDLPDVKSFARWDSIQKDLVKGLVADRGVINRGRLLRLPGSINWKKSYNQFKSELVFTGDNNYYSFSKITTKLEKFNQNYTELKSILQTAKTKFEQAHLKEENNGSELAVNGNDKFVPSGAEVTETNKKFDTGYKTALKRYSTRKELSAYKGERHTALESWIGEISYEVSLGQIAGGAIAGEQIIKTLAAKCCDNSDGGITGSELESLLEMYRGFLVKDKEKVKSQQLELVNKLNNITGSNPALAVKVKPGVGVTPVNAAPSGNSGNPVPPVTNGDVNLLLDQQVSVGSWVGKFLDKENDPVLDDFLVMFLREMRRIIQNDGYTDTLANNIILRIRNKGLLLEIWPVKDVNGVNLWGREIKYREVLTEDACNAYLASLITRCCELIWQRREYLAEFPDVKVILESISELLSITCVDKKTGELNTQKYEKLLAKETNDLFSIRLKDKHKQLLTRDILSVLYTLASSNKKLGDINSDYRELIFYQNGWLDLRNGVFTEGDSSKLSLCVLNSFYDPVLSAELAATEQGEWDSAERTLKFLEVLGEACPLFTQVMKDCFPEDVPTWKLVLCIFGYSFLADNPFQNYFVFTGLGGAGKSTLGLLLKGLVGYPAGVSMAYHRIPDEKEGLCKAVGKGFVLVDEKTTSRGINYKQIDQQVSDIMKGVTGGDTMDVRVIYGRVFSVFIRAKFLFTCNEIFDVQDSGGAVKRRRIILDFCNNLEGLGKKQISDYHLVILKNEGDKLATVCGWLLGQRWHLGGELFKTGLGGVSKARDRGDKAMDEVSDPVGMMIRELVNDEGVGVGSKGEPVTDCEFPVRLILLVAKFYIENSGGYTKYSYTELSDKKLSSIVRNSLAAKGILVNRFESSSRIRYKGAQIRTLEGVKIRMDKLLEVMGSWGNFVKYISQQDQTGILIQWLSDVVTGDYIGEYFILGSINKKDLKVV